MRPWKLILPLLALILAPKLWATEPLGPITFEFGVDYSKNCTRIDDRSACGSSNMYGDRQGSAGVRNGSHRLNSTAVSTQPFSSTFSTTISTTGVQFNVLIGVSGDTIYYSTDAVFSRWGILFRGLNTANQKFSFAQAQNSIYMTGNALTDPIFKWDVVNSSFSVAIGSVAANTAVFYAKYLLWEGNYMLAANVRDVKDLPTSTTYYDDKIMYSYLLAPSSFTVDRAININLGDGDNLTGITSKRSSDVGKRIVMAYKQNSCTAVSFTALNPAGQGGDQQTTQVAYGFGHVSDNPPENIGAWDIMLSREGILQWNGGLLTRANLEGEKIVISGQIKNLIDRLITRGTYHNSLVKYYPKSNYLVFAYEDPDLFPQGRMNSMIFYDMINQQWWPMANPVIGSLETDKGPAATGKLIIGDGMDGYMHVFDDPIDSDDSRLEISIDPMETTDGWKGAGISSTTVAVGTASLSLDLTGLVRSSSITKVFVMPLGEWYNKSQIANSDKFAFKIFLSSIGFLSALRVDLEVKDVQGPFDTNFSSVTLSSASLVALGGGSSTWINVEIALSSFPIRPDWVDFQTESVPFARNLTRFGIRFVSTGTQGLNLFFDDIRIVQAHKNPLAPFRLSKRYNFATLADKDWRQVVLTREKQRDGKFYVDVLTGQGNVINTLTIDREIPQEIFVCNYGSMTGVTRLSSLDFSILSATTTVGPAFQYDNGAADPSYLYSYDVAHDRLVKIDRSSMNVVISTYGTLGTGTSNFNYVQEIAVETPSDGNILVVDHMNHRLKEHKKKDFSFVRQYGQLGYGATSFYNPTGADWDSKAIYVLDDTNQEIKKFSRSYQLLAEAKLDINTIGNGSIKVGPEFIFVAYNRGSNDQVYFIDVVLEKRRKTDLGLVSRVTVRPEFSQISSTYSLRGSIALQSKFVYVVFNDNSLSVGNFYLQKRLQTDLSLVDEYATTNIMSGVVGDNLAREPAEATEGIDLKASLPDPYLQLRFYTKDELESSFSLIEMSILAEKNPYNPVPGKK